MPNTTTARPPLGLPKRTPVTVRYLRAHNDRNGNPRRCYVVTDLDGRHVETIDEGYSGNAALYSRWPWFNSYACERLGLRGAYVDSIDVGPSEYKRMLHRDGAEGTERLHDRADRYARRFDPWGKRR
jgi:hypothetical protein